MMDRIGAGHGALQAKVEEDQVRVYELAYGRRREFCHSAGTPLSVCIETPAEGRGGCSRMAVSLTAELAVRVREEGIEALQTI